MKKIIQQFELIDAIITLAEIAEARGLLEIEKYIYFANNYDFLANSLRMVIDGTDPEIVRNYLTGIVESEIYSDIKLLKKIAKTAVPAIQSGIGSPLTLRLKLFAIADPAVEEMYYEKRLLMEKRKDEFYILSVLIEIDSFLKNRIEKFFLRRFIEGNPVDITGIDFTTIGISLLGCSRFTQVKIFEHFPFIEQAKFLDWYSNEKICRDDVINSIKKIEEWEARQQILKQKLSQFKI